MRYLIAISSWRGGEDAGHHSTIRETWLAEPLGRVYYTSGVEYKFFVGDLGGDLIASSKFQDDVVEVPCADGYAHLTFKTREKIRWALERDYDFVFCCFTDTYVQVDRLMQCGFQWHDQVGDFNRVCPHSRQTFLAGGPGYWLSRKAMEILGPAYINDAQETYEDRWVGWTLSHYDDRLSRVDNHRGFVHAGLSEGGPLKTNTIITSHLSAALEPGSEMDDKRLVTVRIAGGYRLEDMRRVHEAWLRS